MRKLFASIRQSVHRAVLMSSLILALSGCTQMTLDWAALKPSKADAVPPLLAPLSPDEAVSSVDEWETQRRPRLQQILQDEIYGQMPEDGETVITASRLMEAAWLEGQARVEEIDVEVTPIYQGTLLSEKAQFTISLVLPTQGNGPFPIIMMETFCPRASAVPLDGAASDDTPGIFRFVFGRYICRPPYEDILAEGYAVAVVQSTQVVPDQAEAGLAALKRLSPADYTAEERWGAVGAWAWTFSRTIDALSQDTRIDKKKLIAWGHSRYGKAALLAAAYDSRVAGVIAHQSGTGGASLNRQKKGESIKAITDSYPHWFSRRYASYAEADDQMTLDQHHLLALIAPRPVLLGNARRDVWSDPNGAFRAAEGASPAYELYGKPGLTVDRLDQFIPSDGLSYWIRPGTHGVVKEDWPAFFRFLRAHFPESAKEDL